VILCELELHNFGVYAGTHRVRLDPPDASQPIVLFGGLNGAGKTTILEAVQLALHGKRTQTAKREGLSYEDYLRRCIHQSVSKSEGAAVRLRFQIRAEGELRTLRISRDWREGKAGIREVEEVHVGEPGSERLDRHLTDNWAEYIDEIIPIGIAPLFFFDADRIEGFADLANSGELIRTAVHGLLGLDLVDRLVLDLKVLERRKLTGVVGGGFREALHETDAAVEAAQTALQVEHGRVEELEKRLDDVRGRLEHVEARFRREGGDLYIERGSLEAKQQQNASVVADLEEELRVLAAGDAPLLLVRDLLLALKAEDEVDQAREASEILDSVLSERDQVLLDYLRASGSDESLNVQELSTFLTADRERRALAGSGELAFGLSREARHDLDGLLGSRGIELRASLRSCRAELAESRESRDELERDLEGVPNEDAIAPLLKERGELRSMLAEAERNVMRGRDEHLRVSRAVEKAEGARSAVQKRAAGREWEDEAAHRTARFSEKARVALSEFRGRVLSRNIERIERLVLESFQQLLRKRALVHGLEIDPDTLALRLTGAEGQAIHPDRLSAGERQLLAVSLLWGLARASQRTLPMIVDTPLGRLDSVHREHLVSRYFPHASHQVVLLSTDEEINGKQLERLEGHVGRSYHLEFDDICGRTEIVEGYFATEVVV
jgi:DNA sulfur modification protein DndD